MLNQLCQWAREALEPLRSYVTGIYSIVLLVLLYTVLQALNILVTIPEKEKKENLVDKIFSIKWPPGEN